MTRTFHTWEYDGIETILGYQRIEDHPLLIAWLATPPQPVDETTLNYLTPLQKRLIINADAWNEPGRRSG